MGVNESKNPINLSLEFGTEELKKLWGHYSDKQTLRHKDARKFLRQFATATHTPYSSKRAKEWLKKVDPEGSGVLSYSQFKNLFLLAISITNPSESLQISPDLIAQSKKYTKKIKNPPNRAI
eukprot:TRINITY_DN2761_c0_g1_i1.p1 TRINITY_DN2761_c0_g1~~TRINITY_DN2761_c0_g1_i1.p1  ORF type:complete len:122 (-),score=22.33 TRINITY_DN2761_c0_g1_i1:14-379(-)